MQSSSEGYFDVIELAKELRSEKLFIQSELESLRQLNERLEKSALELAEAVWTTAQQRSHLKQLFAQGDFGSSSSCCQVTDFVLSPVFVDAHKVLRYQDALVLSELIQRIRASPDVASLWLAASEGDRGGAGAAARALCAGLHAAGAHGGAVGPARAVLRHLAVHRLATAEDPRKMISQESSSFSRLYSEVVEGFRPARMFLMAALRGPLLPLLQLDECLLVDPDKALDRIKKLFNPNSSNSECEQKLTKYRKWTITSLAESASRFIKSLAEHWACFPPSIAWIVRQTALALRATRRIPEEDIHAICTDLVFTNFICQAIINPEAFGVTDIPITNVGRFNLVQVAQTLQMLCLMKYQDIDGKLRDLYSRFEKDAVYSLLDVLLEDGSYSALAEEVVESEAADLEQGILGGVPCRSEAFSVEPVVTANVALFTRNDLQLLVSLLKKIPSFVSNGFDSSPEQINNSASSSSLHQDFQELSIYNAKNSNSNLEPAKNTNGNIASDKNSPDDMENSGETDVACGVTPTSNASDAGKIDRSSADFPQNDGLSQLLRNIQPEQLIRLQKLLKRLPESNFAQEPTPPKKPSKGKHNGTNGNSAFSLKNGGKKSDKSPQPSQEVLVIKLPGDTAYEPIGMIPESKVLAAHYMNVTSGLLCQDSEMEIPLEATTQEAAHPPDPKPMEKRTRFSLSHDEGSIGNTSDNLEAVSEAASNHSVTSSLEMETEDQNDNLSDMVSANVSGRGSPNISGRDTPSSQVTEGDAAVGLAMPQVLRHPIAPISSNIASKQVKLMKRTRNDIEDKFCKFEIKKLLEGDETISIISDTWSTDVLASDSETLGESNYDRNFIAQQNALAAAVAAQQALPLVAPPAPDVSETASESAWSTDALVSDSDRMTEVDMDDCSVARSDTGTARSGGDAPTPQQPHLFSPLNNINRDALLNRRQMNAASSVHTAHPDNMPAGPALPDADGGAFRSNHDTVDNLVVLRSPNRGRSNVSPLYMQTGAASDARSSAAVASLGVRLRSPGRRPVPYHGGATDPSSTASSVCSDSNGVLVNGYHVVPSCYSRLPQPGPSRGGAGAGALDSPLSALDSPGGQHNTYSAYSDGRQRSDLLFDFARAGLNEASNHSVLESEVSTPEGMFHSANSPFVQAVSNGNATSRWLNDPSQKFPIRPEPETPKPSCSNTTTRETIGSVCNNLDEIHSVFKPIVVERNLSDVDDSGIEHSDINERCPILGYMNGDNLSNQELNSTLSSESSFNGVNGFNERFQDNTPAVRFESNTLRTIDFNAEGPMVSRVHSTSMKTTQHSFVSNNLVSNTISRVMKTSESRTSVINISSSRIDKPSAKNDSPLNGVSSGSAISLSTLSVNSADTSTSDRSSSQDVNSENLTERRVTPPLNVSILSSTEVKVQRGPTSGSNGCATLPRNASTPCTTLMKPGASTGAIPKSISFDATAEKSHRYQSRRAVDDSNEGSGLNFGELKNNVKRSGGNLLNKIKIFRNRSRGFTSSAGFGKRSNHQEYAEDISKAGGDCDLEGSGLSVPETSRAEDAAQPGTSSTQHKSNAELSDDILAKYRRKASSSSDAAASDSTSHSGHSASGAGAEGGGAAGGSQGGGEAGGDPAEQEALNGRLRVVLASMDVHSLEVSAARSGPTSLSCLLRLEGGGGALAALGALSTLGGARAPLGALRAAAASRRPYLQYLADCRRALIAAIAELESDLAWQRAESLRQAALASAARARVSLAAREPRLAALQERMRAGLADEKRDILAAALHALLQDIAAEDAWAGAGEWELEQVALTVERAVLGRVYLLAMFPNGDGDSLRDQVLHDHIVALSAGGVGLPERRLAGAPWTQAQRILAHLPAYKTPRDKVECVSRCLSSIMTLLSLSLEGSTPGADDLTPVLVYVIIKVNPPSLLSTVQFVSTFLSAPLEGEQLYCWTQFCSAVEYIKTLDYSRPSRR